MAGLGLAVSTGGAHRLVGIAGARPAMTTTESADERGCHPSRSSGPPPPSRAQACAPDPARLVLPPALACDLPHLPHHPAGLERRAVVPGLVADAAGALGRARPLRGDVLS